MFDAFLREALPGSTRAVRTLAGDLIVTTLGTVGKRFSEAPRILAEIDAYSHALADMLCAYLGSLSNDPSSPPPRRPPRQRRRTAKK